MVPHLSIFPASVTSEVAPAFSSARQQAAAPRVTRPLRSALKKGCVELAGQAFRWQRSMQCSGDSRCPECRGDRPAGTSRTRHVTERPSQQADATLCHVLGRIEPIPAEEDAGERPPEKGTGNARPYLVVLLGELR